MDIYLFIILCVVTIALLATTMELAFKIFVTAVKVALALAMFWVVLVVLLTFIQVFTI